VVDHLTGHSAVDADVLVGDPCFCNNLSRFSAEVLHSRQHLYKLGCWAKNHLSEIRADPRDPWRFPRKIAIYRDSYLTENVHFCSVKD
jgi:hypothetical protein